MSHDRILYARTPSCGVLKLLGRITHELAPALDEAISSVWENEPPITLLVDLTEVNHIDSTSLGLLARLARMAWESHKPKPTIISDQKDVNAVLISMGFEAVFTIVSASPQDAGLLREAPLRMADTERIAALIRGAHEELIAMNPKNRDLFQGLVGLLEERARRRNLGLENNDTTKKGASPQ